MTVLKKEPEGLILEVTVKPNSARTEIKSFSNDEELIIAIAAPADKEKANKELINFISELFDVAKKHISIISGQHASQKRVRVTTNTSLEDALAILTGYIN